MLLYINQGCTTPDVPWLFFLIEGVRVIHVLENRKADKTVTLSKTIHTHIICSTVKEQYKYPPPPP